MSKNHRYALLFFLFAVSSIAGGMGLKDIFEYSLIIGWVLGLIFFVNSLYFAAKLKKESARW
ncbi:MAG TPA: hypothetical protein VEY51_05530 [Chondromyces sp.]|nr:hypothetical protein [Chondromyces sp.]